ncbi:preprotein translocase subunit YidC [Fusarium verticillioides 7600]|uniref:Preprotein translocase subunit YidC n=1 Tax=Gibberella moniliformis (strain M3125 / FGSC 7600) TaxID=334819 RepID=W7M5G2_GIBM7|nr:preprotein translocase subunit YidC [Fusarium verticillioides 7600]EWG42734.1 preprotein translocase subunit YidC [Fusarium verticillioides 7600]
MLPSRGIVRSLPSGAFQRPCGPSMSRTLGRKFDARQFGTVMKSARTPLTSGTRVGVRNISAPVVLGGVASSRQLSLWGYNIYGEKKTEEPVVEAATTPEAPTPPETIDPTPINEAPTPAADKLADVTQSAEPSSVLPSEFDLESIADLANPSILTMPENIGFLKEIGLDYGWGPTSVMQWVLEHVHVYTGLGWGGSIVATALLLRVIMIYPQLRSVKFSAATAKMKADPRSQESLELLKKGYQTGDREMIQKGQFIGNMVRKEYGTEIKNMFWAFVQIPFSFGLFRVINGMIHIPVPSMEDAGWAWFADLTVADPFYTLPIAGTVLLVGTLKLNSKYTPPEQKAMMQNMVYVMSAVTLIATSFLGAGVNLMMVTTGAATCVTAAILNNESVRRALDLPIPKIVEPVYKPPRVTQAKGFEGIRERLTDNLDNMKKSVSDSVGNMTNQYSGTAEERAEKARKEQIQKLESMRRKLERDEFEKKYKR